MFKFEIDPRKKIFLITATGMFKVEEAIEFINQYEEKVKSIDPKQYTLIINAKEQKASSPDVVPLQEKAIGCYVQTPFSRRFSVVMDSAITMQQIKRLGKEELLKCFTFVDSVEDAYKSL